MLAQAIARALDLDDDRVVKRPIEQGSRNNRVSEDLAPFGEAAVRGQDHRPLLVAVIDELEEQVGATICDSQGRPLDLFVTAG